MVIREVHELQCLVLKTIQGQQRVRQTNVEMSIKREISQLGKVAEGTRVHVEQGDSPG